MKMPDILKNCNCGRVHSESYTQVLCENGAINKLPDVISSLGCKNAFVVCDKNTYKAAGEKVCDILNKNNIKYTLFCFKKDVLKPDENTVGSLFMHFTIDCDLILGVGSGVINDSCKILSVKTGRKYIIVGTAPSMDGYLSGTSSMEVDGLKTSLPTRVADFIIGDIDILKNAPGKMLKSGLGDMLAKYVSICDWRISHVVTGEYYCENVASVVRNALKKCVDNREGLLKRDDEAVKAVFEGLLLAGDAMNYAGASRPASGIEHYISHIWDMRTLEFGLPGDFHGIQCAIGTFYSVHLYNYIKSIKPDFNHAYSQVGKFSYGDWADELRSFLGKAADSVIALEAKEKKYDFCNQKKRIEVIASHWDEICKIIDEEIPSNGKIEEILDSIQAPKRCTDIGIKKYCLVDTFLATKDIRDKYILSRLAFDLGIADELGIIMMEI